MIISHKVILTESRDALFIFSQQLVSYNKLNLFTMDKETVLEIIRIIDKRIQTLDGWHNESLNLHGYDDIYIYQIVVLDDLKHIIKDYRIIRDEDKEMGL